MIQRVEVAVNDNGDIILPEVFRNQLGLKTGTRLVVEDTTDEGIRLRVQREIPELVNKQGISVVRVEAMDDLHAHV